MHLYLPHDYKCRDRSLKAANAAGYISDYPSVVSFIEYLVNRSDIKRVIVIGSYRSEELLPIAALASVEYYGYPECINGISQNITSFVCTFEEGLPVLKGDLSKTVVWCTGLVERLRHPTLILRQLAHLSRECAFLLLTTPDRVKVRGYNNVQPPECSGRVMEWMADEFCRLLHSVGFSQNTPVGYTNSNKSSHAKDSILVVAGVLATYSIPKYNRDIAAIMHTYNESDIVETTIRHLFNEGVKAHVIDNWSTDGTFEIANRLKEEGVCEAVLRFRSNHLNEFNLAAQLDRTIEYAKDLSSDWIIHYDADELRISPWSGVKLADAIGFVDDRGFSSIDFSVVNFVFVEASATNAVFSAEDFTCFDFGRHPAHKVQIKAWKHQGQKVDLGRSGGHVAAFSGSKIFPLKFLNKHYPLRSSRHAMSKIFRDRLPRIDEEQRNRGWHNHYDFYKMLGVCCPWKRYETQHFSSETFYADWLLERLSGIGIETEERGAPNINTMLHYLQSRSSGR